MKRTAAASVIDRNNVFPEYTRPEIAFDSLFGHRVTKPLTIEVNDEDGFKWGISPDRQFIGTNVLVQIDGPYHRTHRQQKKSEWEDGLLNEKGLRVLHIDAELLMAKKYHADVVKVVESFLLSNQPTKRLPA